MVLIGPCFWIFLWFVWRGIPPFFCIVIFHSTIICELDAHSYLTSDLCSICKWRWVFSTTSPSSFHRRKDILTNISMWLKIKKKKKKQSKYKRWTLSVDQDAKEGTWSPTILFVTVNDSCTASVIRALQVPLENSEQGGDGVELWGSRCDQPVLHSPSYCLDTSIVVFLLFLGSPIIRF